MVLVTDILCPFIPSLYNVVSTILFAYVLWCVVHLFRNRNMPPGPWFSLPVIGHLHLLSSKMYEDSVKLAQHYGPVFTMRLGFRTIVFVNGPEAVREVLVKRSAEFSDRIIIPTFEVATFGGKGIMLSNGEQWRFHKKMFISAIREYLSDKEILEKNLSREIRGLLDSFKEYNGCAFNPEKLLTLRVANVICAAIFGIHFDGSEFDYQELIQISNDFIKKREFSEALVDLYPSLQYLPNFHFDRVKGMIGRLMNVYKKHIREHEASFDPGNIRDFIDAMLLAKKEALAENKEELTNLLTDDHIATTVSEMFGAGFETTTTTLRWALLYLVNYPHYQDAIHKELDTVVEPGRRPSLNDKPNLPLLQAALLETWRLGNISPMGIPHCSTQDSSIAGYSIPKGTIVNVNLWSVHRDPKCWVNPTVFNPYRFIDDLGNLRTNMGNFYAFSAGRRVCAGESLAKAETFSFLGSILQTFTLSKENDRLLDEQGEMGMTLFPKPYKIIFKERLS